MAFGIWASETMSGPANTLKLLWYLLLRQDNIGLVSLPQPKSLQAASDHYLDDLSVTLETLVGNLKQ